MPPLGLEENCRKPENTGKVSLWYMEVESYLDYGSLKQLILFFNLIKFPDKLFPGTLVFIV